MKRVLNDAIKRIKELSEIFPQREYFREILTFLENINPDSPNIKEILTTRLIDFELKVHHLRLLQDKDEKTFNKLLQWEESINILREIINS